MEKFLQKVGRYSLCRRQ